MSRVEQRLSDLGYELPPEPKVPPGVKIPFKWVRVHGSRAFIAGHGALSADGAPLGPFGAVPSQVSVGLAQESARLATVSMLSSLKRAIGELENVAAWLMVGAFVNADTGYPMTTLVANAASELLLDLYGDEVGAHARVAPGVTAVPFNLPVVIWAELEIAA